MPIQPKNISINAEKKEIMNIFKELWQNNNQSLHRMYDSWEELENHIEIKEQKTEKSEFAIRPCPNCGINQQIKFSSRGLFPYHNCDSCNQSFFINNDYTLRKLTSEERETMPKSWIQIIDVLDKKKLSIVFKIE